MDPDAVVAADRRHVWHPYAPAPGPTPEVVVAARGVRLELADGRRLVDGMASWWSAVHGYGHPALDAAAHAQLEVLPHVMFGGLTHPPAAELARVLAGLAPGRLERVFFADSGSVAVEVAIKMAVQRWRSAGEPARSRILAVRGGYHGDTLGAMSVCDPVTGMHHLFADLLPRAVFAPRPPGGFHDEVDPTWEAAVAELFERHHHELAAAVVEPVMQGAGGMRFHHPGYVRALRRLCDDHGVLLVLDEIATGFGRTGELFAAHHADVAPDILCVGKALTGGYLSLAATLCTDEVAEAISTGEAPALMHGPTFMANPLACAVALASVGLLATGGWRADVARVEAGLRAGLAPAAELPGVAEVRVLGAVGVVELAEGVDVAGLQRAVVDRGVWLRPFGRLLYATPPYVIGDDDLALVTGAMVAAVAGAPPR